MSTQNKGSLMADEVTAVTATRLSHIGLEVRDLPRMCSFYAGVLGLRVSDRGISERRGQEMVFMSGNEAVHHQLVLVAAEATVASVSQRLDHMAFAVDSLAALRAARDRIGATGAEVRAIDHGNAWSIYFADPEGNRVEVFVAAPFDVSQPHGRPLDLDRTDAEILANAQRAFGAGPNAE